MGVKKEPWTELHLSVLLPEVAILDDSYEHWKRHSLKDNLIQIPGLGPRFKK